MASIFTRIIRGEIPSYKIHEDEHTYSFVTLDQIQLGHTLIVPKIEVDHFLDVPEPHYSAVFRNAKPIGKAIHQATGSLRVAAAIVGLEVPHFHLHLVPMWDMSDLDFRKAIKRSPEACAEIQKKITEKMADALSQTFKNSPPSDS